MPIIAATVIRKPRKNRLCNVCQKQIGTTPTLRLFGMGDIGDRPYPLYFHVACAPKTWAEAKITAALQRVNSVIPA